MTKDEQKAEINDILERNEQFRVVLKEALVNISSDNKDDVRDARLKLLKAGRILTGFNYDLYQLLRHDELNNMYEVLGSENDINI